MSVLLGCRLGVRQQCVLMYKAASGVGEHAATEGGRLDLGADPEVTSGGTAAIARERAGRSTTMTTAPVTTVIPPHR